MPEVKTVARWETRGRKYWYELYEGPLGFRYAQARGGGSFGDKTRDEAVSFMEGLIADEKMYDNRNYRRVI